MIIKNDLKKNMKSDYGKMDEIDENRSGLSNMI